LKILSVSIALALIANCLKIMIDRYRMKGSIKRIAKIVLSLCILFEISIHTSNKASIVSEFLLLHMFQLKMCLQTLIFSFIYYYLYKKINKVNKIRHTTINQKCGNWSCRLFYTSLILVNLFNLTAAVFGIINELTDHKYYSFAPYYFMISLALNIIILVFLVMVGRMIVQCRKLSVENFKFNHRTTVHFRKNQYLIESLSLYLLVVIAAGIVKLPFNLYFIIVKPGNSFYLVPHHIFNRNLFNELISFFIKVIIFYMPLMTSQRLFK
jgi:hypothetical protein